MCLEGEKYSFLAREAVATHVARLLFGAEAQEEAPRMIRKGTRVRLYLRKQTQVPDEGPGLGSEIVLGACALATTEMTFTTSPMFQGLDGRWRVCVSPYEEPVLATQVEELRP